MAHPFAPPTPTTLPIAGDSDRFPVRRIFCVGRNYEDHVVEMGGVPGREDPFFFGKPADAVWTEENGAAEVAYPPRTENLHHEMELVIAIGTGGTNVAVEDALDHIYGYAAGVDLTRRDLQAQAKKGGRPWTMAKGFDVSAPISPIKKAADIGHPELGRMWLTVNGDIKQDGDLGQQIWKVPEVVSNLSTYVALQPGDLIMTGTPAGVGPLEPGDKIEGEIEAIGTITFTMGAKPESVS